MESFTVQNNKIPKPEFNQTIEGKINDFFMGSIGLSVIGVVLYVGVVFLSKYMPLVVAGYIEIFFIAILIFLGFKIFPKRRFIFLGALALFVCALIMPGFCLYLPIR